MNRLWKIIFILTVMLPIGADGYDWLDFMQIRYEVSILDILFTLTLMCELIIYKPNFKVKAKKCFWLSVLFLNMFVFIYTVIKSYGLYSYGAIRDSFNYLMCLEFLIASVIIRGKGTSYEDIMDMTGTGYIGFTLITLITYLSYGQIGKRIGGNCFSLSVVLIPYVAYKVLQNKGEKNKKSIVIIACFVINAIITQNRTAIFFVGALLLYIVVVLMKNNASKKTIQRIILMGVFILIAILGLVATKSEVIVRIITGGEIDTFAGRVNTFNYYFDLIKENPFGYGFGFIMHFFTANNYQLPHETYQVDNAFVVYGIKGGVMMLVLFSSLAILPLKANLVRNLNEKKIFRCSYFFLLVATYFMTSQIIHGRATAMFLWTLVGLTIQNYGRRVEE